MSTGLFTLLMVNGRVKTLTAAKPSLFAALIKTSAVDQGDAQCSIVTTSIDLLLLKLKWCPHSRKLLVVIVFNPFLRDVS